MPRAARRRCAHSAAIAAANANGNRFGRRDRRPGWDVRGQHAARRADRRRPGRRGSRSRARGRTRRRSSRRATLRALVIAPRAGVTLTGLTLRGGTSPRVLAAPFWSRAGVGQLQPRADHGRSRAAGRRDRCAGRRLGDDPSSLIDANTATGTTDIGGGLYIQGQRRPRRITVQDSTITGNSRVNGAGIGMVNNTGQPPGPARRHAHAQQRPRRNRGSASAASTRPIPTPASKARSWPAHHDQPGGGPSNCAARHGARPTTAATSPPTARTNAGSAARTPTRCWRRARLFRSRRC